METTPNDKCWRCLRRTESVIDIAEGDLLDAITEFERRRYSMALPDIELALKGIQTALSEIRSCLKDDPFEKPEVTK